MATFAYSSAQDLRESLLHIGLHVVSLGKESLSIADQRLAPECDRAKSLRTEAANSWGVSATRRWIEGSNPVPSIPIEVLTTGIPAGKSLDEFDFYSRTADDRIHKDRGVLVETIEDNRILFEQDVIVVAERVASTVESVDLPCGQQPEKHSLPGRSRADGPFR